MRTGSSVIVRIEHGVETIGGGQIDANIEGVDEVIQKRDNFKIDCKLRNEQTSELGLRGFSPFGGPTNRTAQSNNSAWTASIESDCALLYQFFPHLLALNRELRINREFVP